MKEVMPQRDKSYYNESVIARSPESIRDDGAISKGEIPRGVYPEQKDEILRSAQNDKRRTRNDSLGGFSNERGRCKSG
jgi:hypothetical protein